MMLQKRELEVFFLALKGTEGALTLAEARARDSFIKELLAVLKTFEDDRTAIYTKFCDKNEDGTLNTADNQYHFSKEAIPQVNEELTILLNETVELTPSDKIKEIFEKTTYSPKIGEAEMIDAIVAKL